MAPLDIEMRRYITEGVPLDFDVFSSPSLFHTVRLFLRLIVPP